MKLNNCKIGIVFAGISLDLSSSIPSPLWGNMVRDYKEHLDSHLANIINPLKSTNEVSIFLFTNDHSEIEQLKANYSCTQLILSSRAQVDRIIDGLNKVGKLLNDLDFIILTRFDIDFYKKITDLDIDVSKINFLFREFDYTKSPSDNVTDCFFIIPQTYIRKFTDALISQKPEITHMHCIKNRLIDLGLSESDFYYCYEYSMKTGINTVFSTRQEYKSTKASEPTKSEFATCRKLTDILISFIDNLEKGVIAIPDDPFQEFGKMCNEIYTSYYDNKL